MNVLRFRATRLWGALALGWLCACGSGSDSATPDGGPGDGGPPQGDGAIVTPDGPITFGERLLGFDGRKGFVVSAGKRIVSLADALSPSTAAITTVSLEGTKGTVKTIPATGKAPAGHIEAIAYDPGLDLVVMIVRAQRPHRIEVVTLAVTDTTATFTTLTQKATVAADGYMFNALYTRGGGGFVAPRGNDLQPFTISGSTLTWQPTSPASSFLLPWSATATAPTEGGLYAFGKATYDPVQKKLIMTPEVTKNVPVGPSWVDVPLGGQPPTFDNSNPNPNPVAGFSAYDAKGKRLLVGSMHEILPCPPPQPKCSAPGLWIADFKTNTWSKGPDFFSLGYVQSPWAIDDEGRRALTLDGGISAMALDETSDWAQHPLTLDGNIGVGSQSALAISSAGTILAWDSGYARLRTFDATNTKARWETFGTILVPDAIRYADARTLTWDAAGGQWIATTSSPNDPKSTLGTWTIDAKGTSFVQLTTTGAPPPRAQATSIVVGGTLYLIAGATNVGGAALDDVWALDLKTKVWKELPKLPKGIFWPTVRQVSPTELWVIGLTQNGSDYAVSPVTAIDLGTGTSRVLDAHGDAGPTSLWSTAPLGTGFVGVESGTTVDSTQPNLWTVTKDADGVVWKKTPIDADDYALNGLRGVGRGDGSAYFVGAHLWQATIGK